MNNHQKWLDIAERLDKLRVFPRLFLLACFWFAVDANWYLIHWYTRLPTIERGPEASGFGGVVLLGIMAFLKMVYETYSRNGTDWDDRPPTTSTTLVQQTTATGTPP